MPDQAQEHPSTQPESLLVAGFLVVGVTTIAGPTAILNRGILPALPGSRIGIAKLLDVMALLGAWSSQLLAILTTLLLVHLVRSTLGSHSLDTLERLILLPIAAVMALLLIAASGEGLVPELLLTCSALGTVAVLAAVRAALRNPLTRAAGLLLMLIGSANLAHTTVRLLAFDAASDSAIARVFSIRMLSTVGHIFDALSLLWLLIWILLYSRGKAWPMAATAVFVTATVVVVGHHAAGSSFLPVLLGRALSALSRSTAAYLGPQFLGPTELFGILLGLGVLFAPRRCPLILRASIAAALLGRAAPDIPMHAALMVASSILITLIAHIAIPPPQPLPASEPPAKPETEERP
jgi:hypothetical protein